MKQQEWFTFLYLFIYFFLRMGTQNGHILPFLKSVSLRKGREGIEKYLNKLIAKVTKIRAL